MLLRVSPQKSLQNICFEHCNEIFEMEAVVLKWVFVQTTVCKEGGVVCNPLLSVFDLQSESMVLETAENVNNGNPSPLEALLAGAEGFPPMLEIPPDADDETMVELAIALSLQQEQQGHRLHFSTLWEKHFMKWMLLVKWNSKFFVFLSVICTPIIWSKTVILWNIITVLK